MFLFDIMTYHIMRDNIKIRTTSNNQKSTQSLLKASTMAVECLQLGFYLKCGSCSQLGFTSVTLDYNRPTATARGKKESAVIYQNIPGNYSNH